MSLYITSLIIFCIGSVILYSYSKNIFIAFIIALIKTTIFYIYFNSEDLCYAMLDDIQYYNGSLYLYNNFGFLNAIENSFAQAGGRHILYYLYNYVSFFLFGKYYYSPVALNIILTFVSSFILFKVSRSLSISNYNSLMISFLFCLHWDVLSWSSILNLKDILVQFLLLVSVYIYLENKRNFKIMLLKLTPFLIMIYFIRFYLVFIFLLSIFLVGIKINRTGIFRLLFIGFVFYLLLFIFDKNIINIYLSQVKFEFLTNIIRFLLTPIPFNYDERSNFLVFSAILTWLTFPFLITGFLLIITKRMKQYNFLIILNFSLIIFYATYDELLGPRQRLMLVPYFSILIFLGFQYFYKTTKFKRY